MGRIRPDRPPDPALPFGGALSDTEKDIEEWLTVRTKDFIDDALHFLIARQKRNPRVVSEMLVRTFYNSLFEAVVKAEAYAGRLPLGASSKSVRTTEFVHEIVINRLIQMAISEIQPGSKYLWTAWITKKQKPL